MGPKKLKSRKPFDAKINGGVHRFRFYAAQNNALPLPLFFYKPSQPFALIPNSFSSLAFSPFSLFFTLSVRLCSCFSASALIFSHRLLFFRNGSCFSASVLPFRIGFVFTSFFYRSFFDIKKDTRLSVLFVWMRQLPNLPEGNPQVLSAQESLTSVFGMRTGGSSPLSSPQWLYICFRRLYTYLSERFRIPLYLTRSSDRFYRLRRFSPSPLINLSPLLAGLRRLTTA